MPILETAAGAALVAGAGSIMTNGMNAMAQGNMNRKTRKWSEDMYARQRADALSDWELQNQYNSPKAMMQRYRDAGLNPALIYGQSNEGAVVRSTQAPNWSPDAPRFDLDARPVLASYYDVKMKEANLDNLERQNTVLMEEALLKESTRNAVETKTNIDLFNLGVLDKYGLETAEAKLNAMKTATSISLQDNERRALTNSQSLKEGLERILKIRLDQAHTKAATQSMQAQMDLLRKQLKALDTDIALKNEDLKLKRNNVQPHDPLWQRKAVQWLESQKQTWQDWKEASEKVDWFKWKLDPKYRKILEKGRK